MKYEPFIYDMAGYWLDGTTVVDAVMSAIRRNCQCKLRFRDDVLELLNPYTNDVLGVIKNFER